MAIVMEHLQEHLVAYIVLTLLALPLLYITRRYSVPTILYTFELSFYYACLHVVMNLIVQVTKWFKINSSMRALKEDGTPEGAPEWRTPLLEFWKSEEYDPHWVLYVELAIMAVLLYIVWRYRPLRIQKKAVRTWAKGGSKRPSEYDPKRYSRAAAATMMNRHKGGKK